MHEAGDDLLFSMKNSIKFHGHVIFTIMCRNSVRVVLLLKSSWSADGGGARSTQTQRQGESVEGDRRRGHLIVFHLIVRDGGHVERHDELVIGTLPSRKDHIVELLLGAEKNKLRVVMTF